MLQFPFEIIDGTVFEGRAQVLGTCRILFPAYKPKFNSDINEVFEALTDNQLHIKANIIKRNSIIMLTVTHNQKIYSLNSYMFSPSWSDAKIVDYLQTNEGWTPKRHSVIQHSLKFKNLREDKANRLYEWEHYTLKLEEIEWPLLEQLFIEEIGRFSIKYELIQEKQSTAAIATTFVDRYAGYIARPVHARVEFYDKAFYHSALHEIAHLIDVCVFRAYSHGPTFMLTYAKLLKKYYETDLLPSMIEAGLIEKR